MQFRKAVKIIDEIYLVHRNKRRYFLCYAAALTGLSILAQALSGEVFSRYLTDAGINGRSVGLALALAGILICVSAVDAFLKSGEAMFLKKCGLDGGGFFIVTAFHCRFACLLIALLFSAGWSAFFIPTNSLNVIIGVLLALLGCWGVLVISLSLRNCAIFLSSLVARRLGRMKKLPNQPETKTQIIRRRSIPRPVQQFILRDLDSLLRYPPFIILSIGEIIVPIALAAKHYTGLSIGVVFLSIIFNALFVQRLMEADAGFVSEYRKLPLPFVHFLGYCIASAVIVLSVLPACMGIFIAMTHGSLAPDVVYLPIAFAVQAFLLLYYVSIILIFFPNARKADLPLLIGFMVIPLAIFWIPLGLRRGRAQWKEWPRNA
jgi:hypothetical protein